MCAIAGFFGEGLSPREANSLLKSMADALAHRGPDAEGVFTGNGIGLAHRRLAIVGLSDGLQPMRSADGDLCLSYNGEIFNHLELRTELESRGHRFRTGSDTEVILHLYDEMGPACVEKLNGDFAFALWDSRRRRLMLARDRMGVRPLYHTRHEGRFYFASEVKGLLAVQGIEAKLDPIALDQIFTFWAPLAPRTAFEGIEELPPAHIMLVEEGRFEIRPYWRLEFGLGAHTVPNGESTEEMRALLSDATRIRLRADVEVGAYLSGGLDSALITTLAAPLAPAGLRSFGIGFDDEEYDETPFQNIMASRLGTRHEHLVCGQDEIASAFADTLYHTEQPVLRTAPAPLYLLSRFTRSKGIKAVLSGEGADEIFAGYDIFREARIRRFCARQPASRLRPHLFRRIYPYLTTLQKQTPDYLGAFFGIGADSPEDPLFSHRPRMRATVGAKLFFGEALRERLKGYDAADEMASLLPAEFARWHPLEQAQYLETRFLMPGYILSCQGDRVAMAHGIETRYPFLDHRLVEAAARLPPESKLRGLREKHVLREAARDLLPREIANRAKQPYRAPESVVFSGEAGAHVRTLLSERSIGENGLFNPRATAKLLEKSQRSPLAGFRDNAAFVGILSTEIWHRHFTHKTMPTAAPLAV